MKTTIPIFILLQAMGLTTKKILFILGENSIHLEDSKVSKALHKLNKLVLNKDLNLLCFIFNLVLYFLHNLSYAKISL